MSEKREPYFVVEFEIRAEKPRPELLVFQIRSKRQHDPIPGTPPEFPVGSLLEVETHYSPLYVLRRRDAVEIARSLLNAAKKSQDLSDEDHSDLTFH